MIAIDRDAFVKLLTGLAGLFGRELQPGTVDLYWDALKDLALSTVQTMAKHHAKFGRFFPKPFELRPAEQRAAPVRVDTEAFKAGEKRAFERLEALRVADPAEWLRQVTPRVTELGVAKGMLPWDIQARIERYQREGPR